jgi:S1-C subfamily serine protease
MRIRHVPGAATALLAAVALAHAAHSQDGAVPAPRPLPAFRAAPAALAPEQHEARTQLVRDGERALERGDTERAIEAFERAGLMQHRADAELGLVRAMLQAGEYRRALAFAAHTAGAHPDTPSGAALYAYLLHLGGQSQAARRVLGEARARAGDEPTLIATSALLDAPDGVARDPLLAPPARFAPYAIGSASPPASARVVGSGVLLDGGHRALVPARLVAGAQGLWVRDGRGVTSAARRGRTIADGVLVEMTLDAPLRSAALDVAARDAFPGSPAFAVEYARDDGGAARWPSLRVGFVGTPAEVPGRYDLDPALGSGAGGGPVFDMAGRLAGITVRSATGTSQMLAVSALAGTLGELRGASAVARVPADAIYERALALAVQLIVAE